MGKTIRGAFIMRLHDHNILTSTYFNDEEANPQPETAKRTISSDHSADEFEGTYNSVWIEDENEPKLMQLRISREPGNSRYKMEWRELVNGQRILEYEGYAVKEKEILFGYYWKISSSK